MDLDRRLWRELYGKQIRISDLNHEKINHRLRNHIFLEEGGFHRRIGVGISYRRRDQGVVMINSRKSLIVEMFVSI